VKTLVQNSVFRRLSDLRLGAGLLVIIAVASGAATLVENHYNGLGSSATGRAAAYDLVYDALWFNMVLVVLFVNLLLNLVRRCNRGRPAAGFLLLHIGILVILIGAGITRWFGFEGYLHIREGESNRVVSSADTYARLRAGDLEAELPVRLYRSGEQRLSRRFTLDGRVVELGVAEFWPRFERTVKPGADGFAQVSLGVMEDGSLKVHTLREGDDLTLAGIPVRFHRGELPPAAADARYGVLRVRAGGEVCRLPIVPALTLLGECGGWTFELSEFQSDYHTQGVSDPEGPLRNPMIRVVIGSPTGESATRTLFALHHDFALAHEDLDLLRQVDLLYELGGGIDLAKQEGRVVIRASFPLEIGAMGAMGAGGETRTLAAGEVVPLEPQVLYRSESGLRMVPSQIETSLVSVPSPSQDPNAPSAARLYVAHEGRRVDAICIKGGAPQRVQLGDQTYWLAYGSVMRTLPYEIFLQEFRLETYPGSDNPASYESHVLLYDPEHGIDGRPVRIWMNNPLNHRGTKHFQSSYDQDRQGTILSINRDPGKIPTYIGYSIFTLGFVLVFGRVIAGRARGRLSAPIVAAALALGLAWLAPAHAAAQQAGMADNAGDQGPPPTLRLSSEVRAQAARLIVQDFRGRMKPLDTLARETSLKITKRSVFEGHDPVELFLAFAVVPSAWYYHPAIAIDNPGVKDLLGISHDQHHVALATVLAGGRYRLQNDVELAHRTAPSQRSKTQQKLIAFDERVHLLFGALQGASLRIFPLPDDPGNTWGGIQAVLERLGRDDPRRAEFEAAAEALFTGLEAGDQTRIASGLQQTAELQRRYGQGVKPSSLRINAELQLNRLNPFARSTLPYLAGFVLLITAYFFGLFRRDEAPWSFRHPLYALGMLLFVAGFALHVFGFVLRWIASGRAPLSNGHESLLWVALAVGLAGLVFEIKSRTAAAAALGSLLAAVVLGVAQMSVFDPAIGPLVPVLASYWLNIHVTIITASYGFLGLCSLLGFLTLLLLIIAALSRRPVAAAVAKLDRLNFDAMIVGLGLLAVGTLLGGVWANESWGRYWGWDPKETWALVSVLVYAMILHFRWIPKLANAFVQAAWSFIAIWVIIMTYFGVNYLLVGLHSYAAGEAASIPTWVIISFLAMLAVAVIGYFAWRDSEARGLERS